MSKDWDYYQNKIRAGEDTKKVILEVRKDFGFSPDYSFNPNTYVGIEIPLNLEREYLTNLIRDKKYKEAKEMIEEMKLVYRDDDHFNFIEVYEYHLIASLHADENIVLAIEEAKKEFNQHTITIVAVVVGVITLLGTANQVLVAKTFEDGLYTFVAVTVAILCVICVAFSANKPKP